jgi:hypothetical protein
MHPMLTEEIVKVCRQREKDGDCPTVEAPGRETLEFAVIELAAQRDRLREQLKIALDSDTESDAGRLHPEAPRNRRPLTGEEQT